MSVIDEVRHERQRQRSRWGAQHDRNHSWWDWQGYMRLRLRLVEPHLAFQSDMDEASNVTKRRRALIELAALAIAAIEANDA
jgi:hypothetical protein